MSANGSEVKSREIAEMLVYTLESLGRPVETWIKSATGYYGDTNSLNEMVVMLCELCSNMSEDQKEKIIYDRIAIARALANWWDEHQEADKKRKEKETFGLGAQS